MNNKMIYSLAAFAVAIYAIVFLRSDFRDQQVYTVNWQLIDGRLVEGEKTIKLEKDQQLRIIVQSNRAEQLHLQGYKETLTLSPDTPQTLDLSASKSGRFKFELQPKGSHIGTLTVSSE
ncbi:hypothetical protein [Zhongshania sp.]|uniref:hypothetical protein n=1 Tax=Zhongshania sp. TaxID=1971902 RepID=UPI00356725E9